MTDPSGGLHGETIVGMLIALACAAGMLIAAFRERKARKEREAKAAILRAAINSAHIGMTITCVNGPITKVNPAFERMLGYSADEIASVGWGALSHPDDHDEAGQRVSSLLSDPSIPDQTVSFFCRYRHRDGHYVPAFVNVTLVPCAGHDDGDLFLAQIQDVNEFRRVWDRTSEAKKQGIDTVSMA